jgi:branched-chain amino acid aminotransferase
MQDTQKTSQKNHKKILINGKLVDARRAKISVFDRGFMYGDGVFESLHTYHGKPFLLKEHLGRLFNAAKTLGIEIPNTPGRPGQAKSQIQTWINTLLKVNKLNNAYIKIILTRGVAKRHGLSFKNATGKPTLIIITEKIAAIKSDAGGRASFLGRGRALKLTHPWKIITVKSARAQVSRATKGMPAISTIKSLNYLENILAKAEAEKHGAHEAVFLDKDGNVLEGTVSNIFIVKNGALVTPPLTLPILPGVTRAYIIKLARKLKIEVKEQKLKLKDLLAADECFLTFSGEGIVPVRQLNQHKFPAGAATINLKRVLQAAAASA